MLRLKLVVYVFVQAIGPAVFGLVAFFHLLDDDVDGAIRAALLVGVCLVYTVAGLHAYRDGYWKGVSAGLEAVDRAQSQEELDRLLKVGPPKPWH